MMSEKVIVEKVDERFTERFKELINLRNFLKEDLDEAGRSEMFLNSKKVSTWYDLRKRYGLENVEGLELSETGQIVSPKGRIFVDKLDEEFVKKFSEIEELREKFKRKIGPLMKSKEVYDAKEYLLMTEVTEFYHLEEEHKKGFLLYNWEENQIVLIDKKELLGKFFEGTKNFIDKLFNDLGR